jgi:hypothetical protein
VSELEEQLVARDRELQPFALCASDTAAPSNEWGDAFLQRFARGVKLEVSVARAVDAASGRSRDREGTAGDEAASSAGSSASSALQSVRRATHCAWR